MKFNPGYHDHRYGTGVLILNPATLLPVSLAGFSILGNNWTNRYNSNKKSFYSPCGYIEVILSRGKTAKISPDDYERVSQIKNWQCFKNGDKFYAVFHKHPNAPRVSMPQWILHRNGKENNLDGLVVRHINGDTLDNRRENLKVITRSQCSKLINTKKIKSA